MEDCVEESLAYASGYERSDGLKTHASGYERSAGVKAYASGCECDISVTRNIKSHARCIVGVQNATTPLAVLQWHTIPSKSG